MFGRKNKDPKKKGTSVPTDTRSYEERREDQKRKIAEQLQRSNVKKEEQAKKEEIEKQKEETMSDLMGEHGIWKRLKAAQKQVQAEENEELSDQLKMAKKHINEKTPPSVKAVFELIEALNSFKGEIGFGTDQARLLTAGLLGKQLLDLSQTTKGHPEHKKHQKTLEQFEKGCSEIMKKNYKLFAAEPTLWNYIKDKFNSAMKAVGLTPKGRIIDTTLDSSAVIKDENVQAKLKEILKTNKIEIEGEPDVDTPLRGPK